MRTVGQAKEEDTNPSSPKHERLRFMARATKSKLKGDALKLWKAVTSEYELEPHTEVMLQQACDCLTRIDESKAAIKADGLFTRNHRGDLTEHPASKVEQSNRRLFKVLIRELGLDIEPADQGYSRAPAASRHGRSRSA